MIAAVSRRPALTALLLGAIVAFGVFTLAIDRAVTVLSAAS